MATIFSAELKQPHGNSGVCCLQHISHNVASSLALQVIAVSSDVERRLDVLLVFESSEKVAQTGQEEEHSHNYKRGGLEGQTQELDGAHQQVEAATRPVVIEVADEVGESVGQWADLQQKWNLHEEHNQALNYTDHGEDDHQVEVEDVGNSQRQTQDDGEEPNPLPVEGEVLLLEIQRKPAEKVGEYGQNVESHFA